MGQLPRIFSEANREEKDHYENVKDHSQDNKLNTNHKHGSKSVRGEDSGQGQGLLCFLACVFDEL